MLFPFRRRWEVGSAEVTGVELTCVELADEGQTTAAGTAAAADRAMQR